MQRLGWAKGRAREARVLGRIITLGEEGAMLEADPALLEEVVHALGLSGASSVVTPAVKSEGGESGEEVKKRRLIGDVDREASGDSTLQHVANSVHVRLPQSDQEGMEDGQEFH